MRQSTVAQSAGLAIGVAFTSLAAQQPGWVAQLGYLPGQTFAARRGFRGMPFVEVVIAGSARWLLFDTGNTVGLTLATPVIDELHLTELGRWKRVDASGRAIGTFRRVRASSLVLLGHVLTDQTVFEVADTALGGLVGLDALPGTRFTIDYQSQLLAVTEAPLEDPPPGFITLPLVRSTQHPRLILAMGRVAGRPVLMEFDTGASRTSIDPHLARDLGLVGTANGVRLDSLSLGSLTFAVASARLDAKTGIDPSLSPPLEVSVGSDILAQVVLTVDFSTGRLLLVDTRRH
jgi:predicted aspartyl protease